MDSSNAAMLAQSNPNLTVDLMKVVTNKYVVGVVSLLAVAYGARYMPKLPAKVDSVLSHGVSQFVIMLVIAYLVTGNFTVAVICALVALILILLAQMYLNNERMRSVANREGRLVENSPVMVTDGVYKEEEPLNSETVMAKPSGDVMGYSNLWRNNEPVSEESVTSEPAPQVAVASTVSTAVGVAGTAVSAVASELESVDVPTVATPDKMKLPVEINPDAIMGVMNSKQTNLATL